MIKNLFLAVSILLITAACCTHQTLNKQFELCVDSLYECNDALERSYILNDIIQQAEEYCYEELETCRYREM